MNDNDIPEEAIIRAKKNARTISLMGRNGDVDSDDIRQALGDLVHLFSAIHGEGFNTVEKIKENPQFLGGFLTGMMCCFDNLNLPAIQAGGRKEVIDGQEGGLHVLHAFLSMVIKRIVNDSVAVSEVNIH